MNEPALRRELGKWDFSALGVNQVIGGAVFLMPAIVAAQIGAWSWIAIGLAGVLAMMIALNFAEAASRFDSTGGPYVYTREAFGRFAGFEVGWMAWVTRVTSWASVLNGLADALGFYWPGVRVGTPRVALCCAVVLAITAINLRGIKQSAVTINLITVGKLVPLAIFIVAGLPHVKLAALAPGEALTWAQTAAAALYLIFTYGGYETVPVMAGEGREPRRMIPFAMVLTIVVVAIILTLVQIVSLSVLPNLGSVKTPLADGALIFLGGWGALLMTAGAAVSMSGNNMGGALTGSRLLFALAERGDVPGMFGRVNARFQTPHYAILLTSVATLVLALSSSFATMAQSSSVARLLVYAGTCASVLALRRHGRALFTIPGGPTVPVIALAITAAILYGVTASQWQVGAGALVIGAALFGVTQSVHQANRPEAAS